MRERCRLIRRGNRSRNYYCVDTQTGQRASLRTLDKAAVQQLVLAKNQAQPQPTLNLHIASSTANTTRSARPSIS